LSDLPVVDALKFIKKIKLTKSQEKISKKVLKNAIDRLEFL